MVNVDATSPFLFTRLCIPLAGAVPYKHVKGRSWRALDCEGSRERARLGQEAYIIEKLFSPRSLSRSL